MSDRSSPGARGNRHVGAFIADLVPQGRADVAGVIRCARPMSIGGAPACRYTLTDGTGELDLLFLGRARVAGLRCGQRCRATGTVGLREGRLVLWNPRYWLVSALAAGASDDLVKPFAIDALLAGIR